MDKKNKFFTKKPNGARVAYAAESAPYEKPVPLEGRPPAETAPFDFEKEVDRVVWERYAHAGFVVNQDLQLVLVRGDTTPYLKLGFGQADVERCEKCCVKSWPSRSGRLYKLHAGQEAR